MTEWGGKADERAGKSEDLPWNTLHLCAIVDSGGVVIVADEIRHPRIDYGRFGDFFLKQAMGDWQWAIGYR